MTDSWAIPGADGAGAVGGGARDHGPVGHGPVGAGAGSGGPDGHGPDDHGPVGHGQVGAGAGAEGAGAGTDLHLDLPAPGTPGVRAALTEALREAVRSGRLAPGTRLPSSRGLAADLGLARNTVADAYGELAAEGWLTARQGSGTEVARRAEPVRPAAGPPPVPHAVPGARTPRRPVYSLMPGSPDTAAFPRAAWLSAARRALTAAPADAFGYGDPAGRPELREALAGYLARARGVRTAPERIVICAGFVQGLMLVGRALRAQGASAVAVDSYGLDFHWDLLHGAGLRTVPLPKDEHGTRVGELAAAEAAVPGGIGAVLLTPAHHFPTGMPLAPDRRAAVVDWARRTGGLVLEDDYDGEFRYDRQPVGALQGLDPECVVHFGTASKSLAPGLRLGWLVLPRHLVPEVLAAKTPAEAMTGTPDQLTLAEFVKGGGYDRHLRAMRLRYRRRRDQLVAALAERAPHIPVTGIAAGLHAVLELPPGTERSVLRNAAWEGLALEGLGRFRHPEFRGDAPGREPDGRGRFPEGRDGPGRALDDRDGIGPLPDGCHGRPGPFPDCRDGIDPPPDGRDRPGGRGPAPDGGGRRGGSGAAPDGSPDPGSPDRSNGSAAPGGGRPPGRDGLVVGYGAPPDHAYAGALDALCRILP
ncbi:MocR-like pyridoxine biosynthesis transcription factor PdxR [Streptomyces lycii]|uniref:MocR-like pyridoxine biosynthesis transcription factor PdxR n=1 Tax=Streptomyces lycii TaxID=2654337 RepID=UPI0038B44B76